MLTSENSLRYSPSWHGNQERRNLKQLVTKIISQEAERDECTPIQLISVVFPFCHIQGRVPPPGKKYLSNQFM